MRLRSTLVAVLLVVTLILSGTVYAGFALYKQDTSDRQRENVGTTANEIATDVDARIVEKRTVVRLWAGNEDIADHGTDRQHRALETFVAHTEFGGASVIAANGTMVAIHASNLTDARRRSLVGRDFSDRTYFQAAMDGSVYVSEPIPAESGNRIVTISAPIRRNGTTVGTLNAALHLSDGSIFADATQEYIHEYAIVVTDGSTVLYRSQAEFENAIVRTATVGSTGWQVTVKSNRAVVTRQARAVTLVQGGAVVLVLASIASLGIWIYRMNLQQIARLTAAFDELGVGNYDARLELSGVEEWERMSEKFNAVSETLGRRETQLRVLNRVLRHNLRNDMNVVIGYAERVARGDGDPAENADRIDKTARGLLETADHARTIGDYFGPTLWDPEAVTVESVVGEVRRSVAPEFPDATVEFDDVDGCRVADGQAFRVALEELCRNALAHNDRPESERVVSISVDEADEEVVVTITDNGPGLPGVESDLLTGKETESPVSHGSGLGVWLVRWMVEAADGTVSVEVDEEGSTVALRLPEADA